MNCFLEVINLLAANLVLCVKELCPLLVLDGAALRTPVHPVVLGSVDQLKDQGSAGDNPSTSRQYASSNKALNHRAEIIAFNSIIPAKGNTTSCQNFEIRL